MDNSGEEEKELQSSLVMNSNNKQEENLDDDNNHEEKKNSSEERNPFFNTLRGVSKTDENRSSKEIILESSSEQDEINNNNDIIINSKQKNQLDENHSEESIFSPSSESTGRASFSKPTTSFQKLPHTLASRQKQIFFEAFFGNYCVKPTENTILGKNFKDSFKGKDLVVVLCELFSIDEKEAQEIGDQFLKDKWITHLSTNLLRFINSCYYKVTNTAPGRSELRASLSISAESISSNFSTSSKNSRQNERQTTLAASHSGSQGSPNQRLVMKRHSFCVDDPEAAKKELQSNNYRGKDTSRNIHTSGDDFKPKRNVAFQLDSTDSSPKPRKNLKLYNFFESTTDLNAFRKPQPKKPSFKSETDTLIDDLTPSQKNAIILKFLESNEDMAQEVIGILKKYSEKNFHDLVKFKGEVLNQNSQKKKKGPNIEVLNELIRLESKNFWHNVEQFEESEVDFARVQRLSSYVPKLVLRRILDQSKGPIDLPEIEKFPAAVMFADISGFTPLTEAMTKLGKDGVEKLSSELNKYFDILIKTIFDHGGDIIKFAGDAVLIVWPVSHVQGLQGAVVLACQCSRAMLKHDNYIVPGTNNVLKMHIGIGVGETGGVHIGGLGGRMEYFSSGQVLEQVSDCEKQASPGEVYVSFQAWSLVEKGILEGVQTKNNSSGNYRLDAVKTPVDLPPVVELPLISQFEEILPQYIPEGALSHISSRRWLAELRNVCVIFINLTSPFKDKYLNDLQEVVISMQKVVNKYQGTIRQFMIDDKGSVMIIGFGLPPLAHEDDPERAVLTAIGIHAALTNLRVPCSIGVTKGLAFCGDVGSERRREYAMIVNLSARLMAKSQNGILCDESIFEATQGSASLTFEAQPPIKVKGKVHPITTYIPSKASKEKTIGISPHIFGEKKRTFSKLLKGAKLIGVETELRNLGDLLDRVQHEKMETSCVVIEGDAGVGKTALIERSIQSFASKIFTIVGSQVEANIGFSGWRPVLEQILDEDGQVASPYSEDPDIALISDILELSPPIPMPPRLAKANEVVRGEVRQSLILRIFEKLIPPSSLIFVENGQWIDFPSWVLVLHASLKLSGILVLIATRPMVDPPLPFLQILQHARHVQLKPLPYEKMAELLSSILEVEPSAISLPLLQIVYEKSQGNPYFTTELVNTLKGRSHLKVDRGRVLFNNENIQSVPTQLEGLIRSKIDVLDNTQQVVIKIAAIIGTHFQTSMLLRVVFAQSKTQTIKGDFPLLPTKMCEVLNSISKTGLIMTENSKLLSEVLEGARKDDTEELAEAIHWRFTNALIPQALYDSMLSEQTTKIHLQIAQFLESAQEGKQSTYSVLAYHYQKARVHSKAIPYLIKSGDVSTLNHSYNEASTAYDEAISLMGLKDGDEAQRSSNSAISSSIPTHSSTPQGFFDSLRFFKKSQEENKNSPSTPPLNPELNLSMIKLLRKHGQSLINLGDHFLARDRFERALSLLGISLPEFSETKKARPVNYKKTAKALQFTNDKKFTFTNQYKEDLPHYKLESVTILRSLAKVYLRLCLKQSAQYCAYLAYEIEQDFGRPSTCEVYAYLSLVTYLNHDSTAYREFLQKARQSGTSDMTHVRQQTEMCYGLLFASSGKWSESTPAFLNAIDAAITSGDKQGAEEAEILMGVVLSLKGETGEGLKMINQANTSAHNRGDSYVQRFAGIAQAWLLYNCGNSDCSSVLQEATIRSPASSGKDLSAIQLCVKTLQTLFHVRSGKLLRAFAEAEACASLSQAHEPSFFITYFAYTFIPSIYLAVYNSSKTLEALSLNKKKMLEKIERSIQELANFAQTFPFAEAKVTSWRAVVNFLNGNRKKAEQLWESAEQLAKKFEMPIDQAQIIYEKATFLNDSEELIRASQLLPKGLIHNHLDHVCFK